MVIPKAALVLNNLQHDLAPLPNSACGLQRLLAGMSRHKTADVPCSRHPRGTYYIFWAVAVVARSLAFISELNIYPGRVTSFCECIIHTHFFSRSLVPFVDTLSLYFSYLASRAFNIHNGFRTRTKFLYAHSIRLTSCLFALPVKVQTFGVCLMAEAALVRAFSASPPNHV